MKQHYNPRTTLYQFMIVIVLLVISLSPQAADFQYEGLINIPITFPLPMAKDGSGGLYVANFNPDGGGSVVYIANPVAAIDSSGTFPSDATAGVVIYTVTGWPAQRGFQGLQVDSVGNVYVSGDDGSTTFIKKLTAGTFVEDTGFAVSGTVRIGGIALLNNDIVVATQFSNLLFFNTANGTLLQTVTGGTLYQRETVYNSVDNVLYSFTSGNNSTALLRGYWSGGSPAALANYAFSASDMITTGSLGTAFGGASGHGYYDATNNWLITSDNEPTAPNPRQIRIWAIGINGTTLTLLQAIDGTTLDAASQAQPFPLTAPRDAVLIGDRLYVASSNNNGSIYVFRRPTSVGDWYLY